MRTIGVLLVDDERLSSHHTATRLRKRGYEVVEAASGEDAVAAVAEKGRIDLVLMDIALGDGMDGFETARSILRLRELPIVFLSVHADDETVAKASAIGSYGFVAKDQGLGILDASIRMAMRLFEAQARLTRQNESLAESENRFRKLFELNPAAMLISRPGDGYIVDANLSLCELFGIGRDQIVRHSTLDPRIAFWVDEKERRRYVQALEAAGRIVDFEAEFHRRNAGCFTGMISGSLMELGGERCMLSVIVDITEKKAARIALERLARMESFVGKATQLMLHEEDERKILEGACRIAVEAGRFNMAWIGLANEGEDVIRCAAGANLSDEDKRNVEVHLSGAMTGAGIAGKAVLRRASVICDDIERDEVAGPWRDACLAHGLRSAAAFPLCVGQRIVGVYAVYATEPRVFGRAETSLLEQLAVDLAFIIDLKRIEQGKAEAERMARESNLRYRESFMQSAAAKLLVVPGSGDIVDANEAAAAYYGYSRETLMRMSVKDLNIVSPDRVEERMRGIMSGSMNHFEARHKLASGELRDVEIFSSLIRMEGGEYLYSIIHDITEKKRAEEALERLVAEKETLLKELQHRVKNNLNVVSGLLSLEADKCREEEARVAFDASISRVGAIAAVYEKLYASEDLSSIDMGPYAEELARTLFETYNLDPERIRLTTDFCELRLDSKRCVPFSLALNELLTNALKYAYPGEARGELRVSLKPEDGFVVLVVEDDGPGVPEEYRGEDAQSMGMTLVRMLVKQLKGEFSLDCSQGTRASIRFPL